MGITSKTIYDITAQNLNQVPASRGTNPISWICIHYLGVKNADNENLYGGGYGGHYYISRTGKIYKAANPRTAVVWQCGGGRQGYDAGSGKYFGMCTNYNSIGIENGVCFDNDWYFTTETQESLVYLVSTLMDEYNIDINHVIRHWDVTGKNCPAPYVSNNKHNTSWTWDEFKEKLTSYRKGSHTDSTYKFQVKQLQVGSTGKLVTLLQKILYARGFNDKNNIDGSYGDKTRKAVLAYQKWASKNNDKLKQDGICGTATWNSILKISGNPKIVKQVKAGDKNVYVYLMQELLCAEGLYPKEGLDMSFGSKTLVALKKYQKKVKLTQDGICGPNTFKKLIGI